MKLVGHIILGVAVVILPQCTLVGPRYKRPHISVPSHYQHWQSDITQGADSTKWWTFFEDVHLNDLITTALQKNYTLQAALEKIQESRYLYGVKTAELFPEIDGYGIIFKNKFSSNSPIFNDPNNAARNLLGLGVGTIWELDIWGRLRKAQSAACAEYRADVEEMRDISIMIIAELTSAYITSRVLERKIMLQQRTVDVDQQIKTLTDDLYQSGLANDIVTQMQVQQLLDAQNQLIVLQKMHKQTLNRIAVLLGENPENVTLEPTYTIPTFTAKIKPGLPSTLLRRRPDIRKAEQEVIAAHEHVGESVGELFPKFSLVGTVSAFSDMFSTWFNGNSLSWLVGPAFTWPLITFGRITYTIKAKKAVHRRALHLYSQKIIEAFAEVENALIDYFSSDQELAISQSKLRSSEREAALVHDRYQAGISNQLEYLMTEKNRLTIEIESTQKLQELNMAIIQLYKALGGGWACD